MKVIGSGSGFGCSAFAASSRCAARSATMRSCSAICAFVPASRLSAAAFSCCSRSAFGLFFAADLLAFGFKFSLLLGLVLCNAQLMTPWCRLSGAFITSEATSLNKKACSLCSFSVARLVESCRRSHSRRSWNSPENGIDGVLQTDDGSLAFDGANKISRYERHNYATEARLFSA